MTIEDKVLNPFLNQDEGEPGEEKKEEVGGEEEEKKEEEEEKKEEVEGEGTEEE